MEQQFIITSDQAGQRLDIFCTSVAAPASRSQLQQAIKAGDITVNNRAVKPHYQVKEGDQIDMKAVASETSETPQEAAPLKLPIIFENKDIVAINKPAGVLVHAHATSTEPTVADWFRDHAPDAQHVGEDATRAGIVHRLDRATSGILLLAKTTKAYEHLKDHFKRHRIKKEYLALVFGAPKEATGRINQSIARSSKNPSRRTIHSDGKPAITEWNVEHTYHDRRFALLRVFPLTGRTHQIRVHLHHIGHPVIGDPLYTFKRQITPPAAKGLRAGQLLHAEQVTLTLPAGSRKTLIAPPPTDFATAVERLENSSPAAKSRPPLGFRTPSSHQANTTN